MSRPIVRAVLATASAAALLVGSLNLASYATTRHEGAGSGAGAGSSPKVIKFHLGVQNQTFNGGTFRFFTAKVPTGNYSVSVSGIFDDQALDESGDSYSCLVVDKKTLSHALTSGSGLSNFKRVYAATGQDFDTTGSFSFGIFTDTNPAAHIDRSTIVYGCSFNGTGPYRVARIPVFTLTKVNVDSRSGHRWIPAIPKSGLKKLSQALR